MPSIPQLRRPALSWGLLLGGLLAVPARAATVVQSGRLLDAQDAPVQGPTSFAFALYDVPFGGTAAWTTQTCQLDVRAGYWSTTLGQACGSDIDALAWPAGTVRYLEARVNGVVLSPRTVLAPVAQASLAAQSQDAQALKTALTSAGTINAGSNPVDWTQLKNVPTGLADGTDDGNSYTAGSGLTLSGGTFAIAAGGVDVSKLAPGSVGTAQLADGAVDASKLAAGIIDASKLAVASVDASKIVSASIGTTLLADGAVIGAKLGAGSVGTAQLADGAVTTAKIAADAVTLDRLAPAVRSLFGQGTTAATYATAGLPTCDATRKGMLVYDSTLDSFRGCNGSSWGPLSAGKDGSSQARAGLTCKQMQSDRLVSQSGAYWIDPNGGSTSDAFLTWCDLTTDGGGWSMVFKINTGTSSSGANASNALWTGGTVTNATTASAFTLGRTTANVLTPLGTTYWNANGISLTRTRVGIYNGGAEVRQITFDASGTNRTSWYAAGRLVGSSWSDLTAGQTYNYFGPDGDASNGRHWMINKNYGGCAVDSGWFVISNGASNPCAWEQRVGQSSTHSVLYINSGSAQTWDGSGTLADAMAIFVRE